MKTFFAYAISSFAIAASASSSLANQAVPCDGKQLAQIKKALAPDFQINGVMLLALIEDAATGQKKCTVGTKAARSTGQLAMCGAVYPKASLEMTISGKNQEWILSVDQVSVSCGSDGYWLKRISTAHGNVSNAIVGSDRVIAEIQSCGNEKIESYQLVTFADGEKDQTAVKTQLVNFDDETECMNKTLAARIIEIPTSILNTSNK